VNRSSFHRDFFITPNGGRAFPSLVSTPSPFFFFLVLLDNSTNSTAFAPPHRVFLDPLRDFPEGDCHVQKFISSPFSSPCQNLNNVHTRMVRLLEINLSFHQAAADLHSSLTGPHSAQRRVVLPDSFSPSSSIKRVQVLLRAPCPHYPSLLSEEMQARLFPTNTFLPRSPPLWPRRRTASNPSINA